MSPLSANSAESSPLRHHHHHRHGGGGDSSGSGGGDEGGGDEGDGKAFDVFLCHRPDEASGLASLLASELARRFGLTVFVHGLMRSAKVRRSRALLFVLTDRVLAAPTCLHELKVSQEAIKASTWDLSSNNRWSKKVEESPNASLASSNVESVPVLLSSLRRVPPL